MLMQPIGAKIEAGTEEREAVLQVTEEMASVLAAKKNEYLRQRADDIRYIGTLLCDLMDGAEAEFSFPAEAEQYIIAARELTPVDTMLFDRSRLAAEIVNALLEETRELRLPQEYIEHNLVPGREICISDGDKTRRVKALEICPDGRLKVEEADGSLSVLSYGEVSIII